MLTKVLESCNDGSCWCNPRRFWRGAPALFKDVCIGCLLSHQGVLEFADFGVLIISQREWVSLCLFFGCVRLQSVWSWRRITGQWHCWKGWIRRFEVWPRSWWLWSPDYKSSNRLLVTCTQFVELPCCSHSCGVYLLTQDKDDRHMSDVRADRPIDLRAFRLAVLHCQGMQARA